MQIVEIFLQQVVHKVMLKMIVLVLVLSMVAAEETVLYKQ
jgi:hypothetical protein